MAYADNFNRAARPGPIAAVIAIHAGIGYLLVTGLGGAIIDRIIQKNPDVIDIPIDPPTPIDEPPPPQPEDSAVDPIVQVPTPPLDFNKPADFKVEPADLPQVDDFIITKIPVPMPTPGPSVAPKPSFDPVAARPRNDPSRWVTTDDYPSAEIRKGSEGTARFRLQIAANGKVESCTITRSSGSARLDEATCRNVERRAKFDPARNGENQPVAGRYESSVKWVLPE